MRLMHGKVSPFVRKVMIAAIEKGLDSKIEIVPTAVGTGKINEELFALNPIGKIPTLVLDDGQAVYDSFVIVDHFDQVKPEPRLIPASGPERLRALRLNAIADGLLIAGILAKTEAGRPPERQWPEFQAAQWAKVKKCIEALDRELSGATKSVTIGEIAVGAAFGWLDLRAPEENWRPRAPNLAAFLEAFGKRASMERTKPQV